MSDTGPGGADALTPRMRQLMAGADDLIAMAKEALPVDPLLAAEIAAVAAQYLRAIRSLQRLEALNRG